MKRDPLTYGIIGALISGVVVWAVSVNAVNNNMTGMMRMMGIKAGGMMQQQEAITRPRGIGMESSMDEMMGSLQDKQGTSFDSAFIEAMIPHHQGAIKMAQVALQKAEHEEIRSLAQDIIAAQNNEITQMQQWMKEWGY